MAASNLTPQDFPWTVSRGDTTVAVEFTLERDGAAWSPDSALAQVRESKSHTSTLVLDLDATIGGSTLTIGDAVEVDVDPGVYYWDCHIVDGAETVTVLAGTFQVLPDVSEPVTP